MPLDLQHYERSLASLKDARTVMDKARAYLDAWPDLYSLARKAAADYLLRHTGKPLDPDRIWWNVFDTAVGAPTFTGWRHSAPPRESVRFTELLIRRFAGGFQQAPDVLPLYGGFYTRGAGVNSYDAQNEVRLDPQQVMDDLWAMDFATLVRERTEHFWAHQGTDFALLARVRFVALLEQGLRDGTLEALDHRRLRAYLKLGPDAPPTLADLQRPVDGSAFTLRQFKVGNGHLLTLAAHDGRVVLYCPNAIGAPRAFADQAALNGWVHEQLAAPLAHDWLQGLARVHEPALDEQPSALLNQLRALSGTPGQPTWPFGEGEALIHDLFVTQQAWAEEELQHSQLALVSNHDLRKQLWRGYLGAFLQVVAPLAPAAWPLSLLVLGAGVARLVFDAEAAANASSTHARGEALLAVLADAVVVAFAIIDVGLGVSALTFRAPPHERLAQPSNWVAVDTLDDELSELDSNRIAVSPSSSQGLLHGVGVDEQGATWIEMNECTVRVRYSPESDGWLAVDFEDPFAFLPNYPLRVVDDGWQLFEVPQPSGVVTDGLPLQASGFWDTYMSENLQLAWEMSQTLLARQQQTLSRVELPTLASDEAVQTDELGYQCVLRNGQQHYTWQQDGELYNQLVEIYSSEMSQVNNLFRHGVQSSVEAGDGDLSGYLRRLFDALDELPRSEAVRMWRGGSNFRLTGGLHYRNGELNPGDVLVTTDITSFTENPYILRMFVAPTRVVGADSYESVFNETSVVYELLSDGLRNGIPAGPLSSHPLEAEVLFTPGCFFRIESIRQVRGEHYHFVKVSLRGVEKPGNEPIHDLRTGELFDRNAYAERVDMDWVVERFFPAARWM
ncbi:MULTISPECIES: dermonecrotic toxin domain-containing protein [unclassified Pseudomonas]|uniref:dermonecrotic toxin domain-containing protein n=1 Tax=unclassified Pseudomonas TaxID=196821 RepID=UPI0035C1AE83